MTTKFTRGSVTQQTRYATTDGRHDFDSLQEAEQHQAVLDLRRLIGNLSSRTIDSFNDNTVTADEILANATLFYDLLADILGKEDAT